MQASYQDKQGPCTHRSRPGSQSEYPAQSSLQRQDEFNASYSRSHIVCSTDRKRNRIEEDSPDRRLRFCNSDHSEHENEPNQTDVVQYKYENQTSQTTSVAHLENSQRIFDYVKGLEDEKSCLETELDAAKSTIRTLRIYSAAQQVKYEADHTTFMTVMDNSKRELDKSRSEMEQTKSKLEKSEAHVLILNEALNKLQSANFINESNLDESVSRCAKVQHELNKFVSKCTNFLEEMTQRSSTINTLASQLHIMNVDYQDGTPLLLPSRKAHSTLTDGTPPPPLPPTKSTHPAFAAGTCLPPPKESPPTAIKVERERRNELDDDSPTPTA